jgi:myo-inositol-1(or 4)-monophosphatase
VSVASLRDLAACLAAQAGARIRAGRPPKVQVAATKSSAVDVVTQMDADSEAFLRAELARLRPDDAILAEETGAAPGTSGLTWVIDPLDGTVNYLYGISSWAVSIAVVLGEPDPQCWTVLAGAVHSVVDQRTYSAGLGAGASCDGEVLALRRPAPELAQCLVGTGFGYDAAMRREQARVLVEVLPRVRDIRRLGAAAIDLCHLAAGRIDLYYERGLNPWDLAAGTLIAAQAGAVVTGLAGRRADREMAVAGPGERVAELVGILEAAGASGAGVAADGGVADAVSADAGVDIVAGVAVTAAGKS